MRPNQRGGPRQASHPQDLTPRHSYYPVVGLEALDSEFNRSSPPVSPIETHQTKKIAQIPNPWLGVLCQGAVWEKALSLQLNGPERFRVTFSLTCEIELDTMPPL